VFLNLFLAILIDGFTQALNSENADSTWNLDEDMRFLKNMERSFLENYPELAK
jgi:hypothetical protein